MAATMTTQPSMVESSGVSHNLLGQRLGRKGRDTRDRIIAALERLLAAPGDTAISLSAVAREASLAMTTLYLYFSDFPELLIAVLRPIMESAEQSYIGQLRSHWSDEDLSENCLRFVEAYHCFWIKHSRILHLRNALADANDDRMRAYRIAASTIAVELLVQQMDSDPTARNSPTFHTAQVLLTGMERLITVATDANQRHLFADDLDTIVRTRRGAEARLLELAIRDGRAAARAGAVYP